MAEDCVYFEEEGVFQGPPDTLSTDFKKGIWTLVDADEDIRIPPSLAVHGTKLLNIFVSYPEPSRWKPLEKTTLCTVANMNPWTRKEVSQALAHPPPLSTFELTFFFFLCSAVIHGLSPSDPRLNKNV